MTKILVVDDNADIVFTVQTTLKDIDRTISVVGLSSGEECLKQIGSIQPDLVLMDIMMPGLDGMDTVIRMKEMSEYKNIPVVFLTAKTDKLSKGMGAVCGEAYIEKPFEPRALYETIQKVLGKPAQK